MIEKIINIESLNIRSEPIVTPATTLNILHLGQSIWIDDQNIDLNAEWLEVEAVLGGQKTSGYIKRVINNVFSIRDKSTPQREELVSQAVMQWLRFDQGQGLEYDRPYSEYVGEMWKMLKMKLDGTDRDMPWSAAFISYIVARSSKNFDKYASFRFASSHSKYLHDSIIKRNTNDQSAPFWGYRLGEVKPQIGDIVARWRETERNFNDAAIDDSFKSHTDIIVSINADYILAIGGNVSQSVSISRYNKSGAGFILPEKQAFMLMANKT